jgi:hypothetical protein
MLGKIKALFILDESIPGLGVPVQKVGGMVACFFFEFP